MERRLALILTIAGVWLILGGCSRLWRPAPLPPEPPYYQGHPVYFDEDGDMFYLTGDETVTIPEGECAPCREHRIMSQRHHHQPRRDEGHTYQPRREEADWNDNDSGDWSSSSDDEDSGGTSAGRSPAYGAASFPSRDVSAPSRSADGITRRVK